MFFIVLTDHAYITLLLLLEVLLSTSQILATQSHSIFLYSKTTIRKSQKNWRYKSHFVFILSYIAALCIIWCWSMAWSDTLILLTDSWLNIARIYYCYIIIIISDYIVWIIYDCVRYLILLIKFFEWILYLTEFQSRYLYWLFLRYSCGKNVFKK